MPYRQIDDDTMFYWFTGALAHQRAQVSLIRATGGVRMEVIGHHGGAVVEFPLTEVPSLPGDVDDYEVEVHLLVRRLHVPALASDDCVIEVRSLPLGK